MKKSLCLLLIALTWCCVTGCSSGDTTETVETEEIATVLTWQEQYDLGMKYLLDGNYEEAIIAFQAAIELEPKKADAYLGLADAYVAIGDTELAVATLEQGLLATEDAQLQAQLDALLAPEDTSEAEDAPSTAETKSIGDYTQFYGTVTQVSLTESTANPGAVAMCVVDFAWDTSSASDPVYTVQIASWSATGFSDSEIVDSIALYEGVWASSALPVEEQGSVSYDFTTDGGGFPVWEEDLGTTQTMLWLLMDGAMEGVGYLLLDVTVPTA